MNAGLARRTRPASIQRAAGFTLIEMMIVVIVIGILAGVALPIYQESMRKSRRTDAREALMKAASREEQYMLDRSVYTGDMTKLGFAASPMISDDKHYSIARVATAGCAVAATTCYALKATPRNTSPQKDDKRCASFTLDSTGAQTATGTDSANCW